MKKRTNQKYTSANTSINSKKLPAIYGMIKKEISSTDQVIDYGCGKFFDNYNLGNNFHGYDPYNRPDEEVLDNEYDIAICSNVLNVVMEREARIEILNNLKELADKIFITVYEGNKTGVGTITKKDCYQLNRRRCDYIPELVEVFGPGHVRYIKRGYFECVA